MKDTFLNNTKIDGELYAYLLSISKGSKEDGTYVLIEEMPSQETIANVLNYKSRQTVSTHMKTLIDKGYVQKVEDRYLILNPEEYFFQVPLETTTYLIDTVKEAVIKLYIYLGTCYQRKKDYMFTIKEICTQFKYNYNNKRNRDRVVNQLDALRKFNLIDYKIEQDGTGCRPYFVLTEFNTNVKK